MAIATQKPPEGSTGERVPKTLHWNLNNDSAQMCKEELLSQSEHFEKDSPCSWTMIPQSSRL